MNKVKLIRNKDYWEQHEKCHGYSPCAICGKPIKNLDKAAWIRMDSAGYVIPHDAEIDPSEDMYGFPIGAACLRNHPELKEFTQQHHPRRASLTGCAAHPPRARHI
jgi:hypothetical protein